MQYMYQMDKPNHIPEVDPYAQFNRICEHRVIRAARQAFREATQIEAIEVALDPMQELKHSLRDEAALLDLDHTLESEIPELIEVERTAEDGSMVYALVPRNSIDQGDPTDSTWLKREEALVSVPKSALRKPLPNVTALPEETRSRIYDRFIPGGIMPEQSEQSAQENPHEEDQENKEPAAEEKPAESITPIQPVEQTPKVTAREKKPRFSRFAKAVAAGVLAVSALVGSMFIGSNEEYTPESDKNAVTSYTIESIATTKALLSEDFANMVDWANKNPGVDFGDAMSNFYE